MVDGEKIAKKLENFIESMGIKKTKIAEVLGAPPKSSNQWKYKKYDSFFSKLKKNKIDLVELENLSHFLGKSRDDFIAEKIQSDPNFNFKAFDDHPDVPGIGEKAVEFYISSEDALAFGIRNNLVTAEQATILHRLLLEKNQQNKS
jgi:hypothetical protein